MLASVLIYMIITLTIYDYIGIFFQVYEVMKEPLRLQTHKECCSRSLNAVI